MNHRGAPVMILSISLLLGGYPSFAQTAEELLPKALQLEEVKGELEEALEIYQTIVREYPDNRPVAAKAQLHIGLCYEKLGKQEAQKAYVSVITDYAEFSNEVFRAQERLSMLEKTVIVLKHTPSFHKIKIASKPQNGILSPDGKKLACMSDGAIWIIPLQGKVAPGIAGEPVRLVDVPNLWEGGEMMAWSADGEWIAVYGGQQNSDKETSVSVIPVKGGKPREIILPEQGGHLWSYRISLSPHGQKLAFSAIDIEKTRGEVNDSHDRCIYTISTTGGEPSKVSTDWARLPSFSPDGEFIAYVGNRFPDTLQKKNQYRIAGDLWVVASEGGNPVNLAKVDGRLRGPVWSPDSRYIAAHFEPGKDNDSKEIWVYELSTDATSARQLCKIALPSSSWHMLSGWTPNDELGVFLQSEEHSALYTVPVSGGKAVQVTPEGGWPYYPRWSKDGTRIYYRGFNEDEDRVTLEFVPATGGNPAEVSVRTERRLVSTLPGGGFNLSPDGKMIVINAYQEPFDPNEGVDIWAIPLDGRFPIRLTNDESFEGYPCWSPDGHSIVFVDEKKISKDEAYAAIYIMPAIGGGMKQITGVSDSVSGGAITFSPDGKRIAYFSDGKIKTIPVEGGQSKILIDGISSSRHSNLAYSPDGSRIAYSSKGKIWITTLEGGEPKELKTGLPSDARHGEFSWSPDGKKITFFSTIGGEAEFWLISDFLPVDKNSD